MGIMNRGVLRIHEYESFRFAPTTENDNKGIDTLIKAFHSVLNNQMFKGIRGGQPVVAMEIYGDSKTGYYLVTVPSSHKLMIKEKLTSAFEGAGVKKHEHKGWPFEDTEDTLVANLTLNKQPFFPIDMKPDTLVAKDLIHIIEDVREGEKVFIQILLEPVENGWQNEIERAYEGYIIGDKAEISGGFLRSGGKKLDASLTNLAMSLTRDDTKTITSKKHREIKEIRQKLLQSGFHVAIRILAQSPTYARRNDLVEGIASSFKTVSGYNQWVVTPVIRKKAMLTAIKNRQMPMISTPALLCDDEVKCLIRFPTKDVTTRRLERMTPDEKKIDERITKDIIPIGRSIKFGEEGTQVGFSVSDNDTSSKGKLFIAPPGSGKTTLAKILIKGAMDVGHGGSAFDVADGSLYYGIMESTEPKHKDKLVLVNFANKDYPHIFNFNSLGRDADTVGEMFTEFFEVFYRTQANHRMNSFLRKGSMTAFSNPDASFLELIMLLRDGDFRKKFLPKIRSSHPDLFLWWKTEFPKIGESQMNEILQPILYRLDELQYNPRLGPMFCGKGGRLDIYNWMNQGKWVIYNISNGYFLENEQRMIMSFLNYAYWSATLAREQILQKGIEPVVHHKIYDEPQTYMNATPVTKLSISKSRKYRVSDNFFIQSPSQVIERDKELWTQILDMNPHIIIGGGLSDDNLKLVSKEFDIKVEELKQLSKLKYHWYFKTYVEKEALDPFIFDSQQEIKTYGRDKKLEDKWRLHFAPCTYNQVKEEINARNFKLSVTEYRKLLSTYDSDEGEGVPLG